MNVSLKSPVKNINNSVTLNESLTNDNSSNDKSSLKMSGGHESNSSNDNKSSLRNSKKKKSKAECYKEIERSLNETNDNTENILKRKRKKRRERKSDPVVSSISELMSNSLSMISPDKGLIATIKGKLNEKLKMRQLELQGPTDDDIVDEPEYCNENVDSSKDVLKSKLQIPDDGKPEIENISENIQSGNMAANKKSKRKSNSSTSLETTKDRDKLSQNSPKSSQSSLTSYFRKSNDKSIPNNADNSLEEFEISRDIFEENKTNSKHSDKNIKKQNKDKTTSKSESKNIAKTKNKAPPTKQSINSTSKKQKSRISNDSVRSKTPVELALKDEAPPKEKSVSSTHKKRKRKISNHSVTSRTPLAKSEDEMEVSQKSVSKKTDKTPKKSLKNSEKAETDDLGSQSNKSNELDNKNSQHKQTKNAFEFMMVSRHKVIGSNSPGKDIDTEPSPKSLEIKNKLSARKKKLALWANAKGGLKRKAEEEERDEIIKQKMDKRAKRLKTMLKGGERLKSKEQIENDISLIDSESSDDELSSSVQVAKPSINDRPRKLSESKGCSTKSSPVTNKLQNRKQTGLLNYFEKQDKNDSKNKKEECLEISDMDEESNKTSLIKIKMFSPKVMNKKGKSKKSNQNKSTTDIKAHDNNENYSSSSNDSLQKMILESKTNLESTITIESNGVNNKGGTNLEKDMPSVVDLGILSDQSTECENNIVTEKKVKRTKRLLRKRLPKLKIKLPSSDDDTYSVVSDGSNIDDIDVIDECTQDEVEILVTINEDSEDVVVEEEKVNLRRSSRAASKKTYPDYVDDFSDNDSDKESTKNKTKTAKNIKLAPVFINSAPKPKIDPSVLQARKDFLHSGVPSLLKKIIDKQQTIDLLESEQFPSISHVIQKTDTSLEMNFWSLPEANLELKKFDIVLPSYDVTHIAKLNNTKGSLHGELNGNINLQPLKHMKYFKSFLRELKEKYPHYPVFKSFKFLKEKCGRPIEEPNKLQEMELKQKSSKRKSKRGKKKKESPDVSVEIIEEQTNEMKLGDFSMWTEKYKPQSSEEIIGNYRSILELKKWLQNWLDYSEESNFSKKRKRNYSSSSEFETDADSRDSGRLPNNTIIITGPHGCGKSTAIYAVCQELGINVLELNASSKRTGKRLLQELQEATQSHQVRNNDRTSLSAFLQNNKSNIQTKVDRHNSANNQGCNMTKKKNKEISRDDKQIITQPDVSRKMCLLLVEDVDIVYEQDEGFISALTQLLNTSKRPIVLVASDTSCPHLYKFVCQYRVISFSALTGNILAPWLQILCILEGLNVDRNALIMALDANNGDVRRTLLQLQFWVQSGGDSDFMAPIYPEIMQGNDSNVCMDNSTRVQNFENCLNMKSQEKLNRPEDILAEDIPDDLPVNNDEQNHSANENYAHNAVLKSALTQHKELSIIYPLNLGLVWWNFSGTLKDIDSKFKTKCAKSVDLQTLGNISMICDSFSCVDVAYNLSTKHDSQEPAFSTFNRPVKDSVELLECFENCRNDEDFTNDWTYELVTKSYGLALALDNSHSFDISLPNLAERRLRLKQHACDDKFLDALPLSVHTDRKSVAMDYFSMMRSIARSENMRANTSIKRNNRFHNYLCSVGVEANESDLKTACDMLSCD